MNIIRFAAICLSIGNQIALIDARIRNHEPSSDNAYDDGVFVSEECAAFLLALGGATPYLLPSIGFTRAAFGNVESGSLFRSLQSIVIIGVGTKLMVSDAIGGAVVARNLQRICVKIDEFDSVGASGELKALVVAEKELVSYADFITKKIIEVFLSEQVQYELWEDTSQMKEVTMKVTEENVTPTEEQLSEFCENTEWMKGTTMEFAEGTVMPTEDQQLRFLEIAKEITDATIKYMEYKIVAAKELDGGFVKEKIVEVLPFEQLQATMKFMEEKKVQLSEFWENSKWTTRATEEIVEEQVMPTQGKQHGFWDRMKLMANATTTHIQDYIVIPKELK